MFTNLCNYGYAEFKISLTYFLKFSTICPGSFIVCARFIPLSFLHSLVNIFCLIRSSDNFTFFSQCFTHYSNQNPLFVVSKSCLVLNVSEKLIYKKFCSRWVPKMLFDDHKLSEWRHKFFSEPLRSWWRWFLEKNRDKRWDMGSLWHPRNETCRYQCRDVVETHKELNALESRDVELHLCTIVEKRTI